MNIDLTHDMRAGLEASAARAARLLAAMANPRRLVVLCHLLEGEKPVGELARIVGLSLPALSQHLAKMRALDLVATRRDGQSIHYRLASTEVAEVLATLYRLYCAPAGLQWPNSGENSGDSPLDSDREHRISGENEPGIK